MIPEKPKEPKKVGFNRYSYKDEHNLIPDEAYGVYYSDLADWYAARLEEAKKWAAYAEDSTSPEVVREYHAWLRELEEAEK